MIAVVYLPYWYTASAWSHVTTLGRALALLVILAVFVWAYVAWVWRATWEQIHRRRTTGRWCSAVDLAYYHQARQWQREYWIPFPIGMVLALLDRRGRQLFTHVRCLRIRVGRAK